MQYVVDSNRLRSDDLREYLSASKRNQIVLTDYAAMEAYCGESLTNIIKSTEVISEFPDQVVILKGTGKICALSGRRAGLRRRMIDAKQTAEFPQFIRDLANARNGDIEVQDQILKHGRDASAHLKQMRVDMSSLGQIFHSMAKTYTKDDRRVIRSGESYPLELVERIIHDVLNMTVQSFETHPHARKKPNSSEVGNTYIFRHCLCGYLLALNWIGKGGSRDVRPEKIRNDVVDANFAACPSSNKWNRVSDYLKESFVPRFQFTRRVVDSATDASRWSFS